MTIFFEFSKTNIGGSVTQKKQDTARKMKFPIKDFFSNRDLVTFTEEILNGKLHFLCSERSKTLSKSCGKTQLINSFEP